MKGGTQRRLREDRADEGVWTLLAGTSGGQVSAFTRQGCLGQGGEDKQREERLQRTSVVAFRRRARSEPSGGGQVI